ncbi:MAG: cytochrome c [Nitrosomonas sp.]|nr:cytochrome c [Nitrosomonas sp.]MDP1951440.1 cytochrome c [Nitrosomonas sp.]
MKLIVSLLTALLLIGIIALGSGAYNMAATEKHWAITEKIIEWVRESSIEARAKDLEVPPLDDASALVTGAEHYDAMCVGCHLAPGRAQTELALGLYPQAPVFHKREPLTDATEILDHAREYFWVIKNGLKMTAMPAWGLSHDDDVIWAMTAFVLKISGMTPQRYEELIIGSNEGHAHEEGRHPHE